MSTPVLLTNVASHDDYVDVMRRQQLDGQGTVFFEEDGRVRLVVSEEAAEAFAAAEAAGISADDIVRRIVDREERERANLPTCAACTQRIGPTLLHAKCAAASVSPGMYN